jgi:GAF domain-containing protein
VSFSLPPYFAEHGIISMLAVPIMSGIDSGSYGVLAVGTTARRIFDVIDVNFLAGFSNALRQAIEAASQGRSLQGAAAKIQEMIADRGRYIEEQKRISDGKDRLLEASGVLARELRHRVRNNLQLILSMLNTQINRTTDPSAIEGFGNIERRVMTWWESTKRLMAQIWVKRSILAATFRRFVRTSWPCTLRQAPKSD